MAECSDISTSGFGIHVDGFELCAWRLKELAIQQPHFTQPRIPFDNGGTNFAVLEVSSPAFRSSLMIDASTSNISECKLIEQFLISHPSLRTLEWKVSTVGMFPNVLCQGLECIRIENSTPEIFASIFANCPNIKQIALNRISLDAEWDDTLNTALSQWKTIETVELRNCLAIDMGNIDTLWRLNSMRTLILIGFTMIDQQLEKVSLAFRKLQRLEFNLGANITAKGFAFLANLDNLRYLTVQCGCRSLDLSAHILELARCKRLEIFRVPVSFFDWSLPIWMNPMDVVAFLAHCTTLRLLELQNLSGIKSPSMAAAFVRWLDAIVLNTLKIRIAYGKAEVWQCEEVRAALAKLNSLMNGRRIVIQIGKATPFATGAEISWDEGPESVKCVPSSEPIQPQPVKSLGRRLIDAIWSAVWALVSKIFT